MKVGVLLGRGVEGVGLTKNVVEFQKLFPGVEVYATIDKLWQRMNSMDFKVNYFRGTDWDEVSKPSKQDIEVLDEVDKIEAKETQNRKKTQAELEALLLV